jgi:hypothetical protein
VPPLRASARIAADATPTVPPAGCWGAGLHQGQDMTLATNIDAALSADVADGAHGAPYGLGERSGVV